MALTLMDQEERPGSPRSTPGQDGQPSSPAEGGSDELGTGRGPAPGEIGYQPPAPAREPEPAEGDDGDDGAGGDTDADDEAGDPHERRFRQERRRKYRAQARAREAEARAEAMEAKLAALEQHMGGLTALELQRARQAAEAETAVAEQAWVEAFEGGDAKGALAAQRRLAESRQRVAELQSATSRSGGADREAAPAADGGGALVQRMTQLRDDWLADNPWYGRADAREQALVAQASAELDAEGYAPHTPAHFRELTRVLSAQLPHRFKSARQAPAGGPPSAGAGRLNNPRDGGGPANLTPEHHRLAREFGVDLNNKEQRQDMERRVAESRARRGVVS